MRVLLVDDDFDTRMIFSTALSMCGYDIVEARDGPEALRRAREEGVDLILMDMQVPGKNGWETTDELRRNSATSHIPVIAVSAHAMQEHRQRAHDAGCIGYITKPVEPKALVEEVQRLLEGRAEG